MLYKLVEVLTIWYIQYYGTADEQRYNLYSISYRFELGSHCRAKAHVSDDDGRERVDDAVWNSTVIYHIRRCAHINPS